MSQEITPITRYALYYSQASDMVIPMAELRHDPIPKKKGQYGHKHRVAFMGFDLRLGVPKFADQDGKVIGEMRQRWHNGVLKVAFILKCPKHGCPGVVKIFFNSQGYPVMIQGEVIPLSSDPTRNPFLKENQHSLLDNEMENA